MYIDDVAKIVYHVEVKTSGFGNVGGTPGNNLGARFNDWIDEASSAGRITNQVLPSEAVELARRARLAIEKNGYSVNHGLMQVEVPNRGASGKVSATLRPWPPLHGEE